MREYEYEHFTAREGSSSVLVAAIPALPVHQQWV